MFALERLAHRITLAERSWVIFHSNHGPYVIGCWYRPPAPGEVYTIHNFKKEELLAVGCVALDDLNVHHRKCLEYSNRNSPEGQELCAVCEDWSVSHPRGAPARPSAFQLPWCEGRSSPVDCRPQARDCYVKALGALANRG